MQKTNETGAAPIGTALNFSKGQRFTDEQGRQTPEGNWTNLKKTAMFQEGGKTRACQDLKRKSQLDKGSSEKRGLTENSTYYNRD